MSRSFWIYLVVLSVSMHLVDAWSTMFFIRNGYATEANPLMAHFYEISPLVFLFFKMFLAILGTLILYQYRHEKLAKIGLIFVVLTFAGVVMYHALHFVALCM